MLTTHLSTLEAKLDALIRTHRGTVTLIGPPAPFTQAEKKEWILDAGYNDPPKLAQWQPPAWIERANGGEGFMLNDQTACFQRGHCPPEVYDQILPVIAIGFKHDVKQVKRALKGLAYDFIIAIRNHTTHEIAAACMVEIRCACDDPKQIPYLYVFELTTNPKFGHHGLAQQLVHATDALAYLLRNDVDPGNIWYRTLHDKRLFMGLTVEKAQTETCVSSLIRLYSRGGLAQRTTNTPQFNYTAFSTYCVPDWKIDENTAHYIAMWKEIMPCAIYSDDRVTIFKEGLCADGGGNGSRRFYHSFPADKLHCVRTHGIVHPKHRCLHGDEITYEAPGSAIVFSSQPPSDTTPFLVIMATCDQDEFEIHTSVPFWYATFIQDGTKTHRQSSSLLN